MDQNKEGMLMVDVADLAFGPVPGVGTMANKTPASPTVFGTHLSVRAASSLRQSMSAEECTPAALKIMGLLKSCQSMYPNEAPGGDTPERDENWANNASRNAFVSLTDDISLPDKYTDTNPSLIPSATGDTCLQSAGGAGKAWCSSNSEGTELGLESAAFSSSRVHYLGSRSRSLSTANTAEIRSRVTSRGTRNEKILSPEILNYKRTPSHSSPLSRLGLSSSGVIPRALVPHDLSGTEVRRAALINNVMSSSQSIFDIMTSDDKLRRSPPPKTPHSSVVMTGAFLRPSVPDTKPHERLLKMERVMSYSGGPSLLLHQGKLLVIASAALLVLIDTEGSASGADRSNPGFWRNFKSFSQWSETGSDRGEQDKDGADRPLSGGEPKALLGCEQAFLKGHTASIGLLELSPSGAVMASAETCARGAVMVWNILEGKRMLTFRPHTDSVTAVAFNHDSSLIVTAGTDAQRRVQIAVWDVQTLATQGAPLSLVARQISEFPISKIRFSPFEDASLVSCGRENIRFFRIRKKHLPACPVQLNEFSRGFTFTDFVYNLEPGKQPLDARKPCAFFSSNRGILLKIDCMKKQIICGFQLHSGPIQALAINEGYAVTGGGDNRLRIWPLDFSDFLLEAQHEASVTSLCVSGDGRKLSVGTAAGTLGVLNVSEHSYDTILRSHVGAITFGVARSPAAEEFVTLGKDTTIRLWDIFSGTQKYEFNSPSDEALCAAYHPIEYSLAVGFKSGALRVFDIESTTTIIERKIQRASVTALLYVRSASFPGVPEAFCSDFSGTSHDITSGYEGVCGTIGNGSTMSGFKSGAGAGHLLLFTAGLDGNIIVYDAENEYNPLKTLSAVPSPSEAIRMALSSDQRLLAVAGGTVSSITVYDTQQLVALYRGGQIQSLAQQVLHTGQGLQTLSSQGLSPSPSPSPGSMSSPMVSSANTAASFGGIGAFNGVNSFLQSKACDPSAILTGIAFCDDRPGGSLLITTDRHIVSLPLDSNTPHIDEEGMKKKKRSAWDSRSVRRLEFGSPVTMTRDLNTGLLFMTLKAPGEKGAETVAMGSGGKGVKDKNDTLGSESKGSPGSSFRSRSQADCMAIVAARHRPFNPQKLSLSAAQIYQDHLGGVNGICPCTPCGRVVSFDDAGSMIIWRLLDDQVTSLKASNSPSYQTQSQGITGRINRIEMESEGLGGGKDEENEGIDSEDEAIKYERIQDRKKIRPPREKKEKFVNKFEMRARGLIKDFELAVKEDPDAWCASTFPSYADDRDSFPTGPDSGPSISNNFSTIRVDRGVSLVDFHSSEKTRFAISSIFGGIEDDEESDGRISGEYGGNDEGSEGLNETERTLEDSNSDCCLSRSEDKDVDSEEEEEEDSFGEAEEAISGLSHWHSVNPDEVEMEEIDVEVMMASRISAALDMRKQSAAGAMKLIKQRVRDRRAQGLGQDTDIPSGLHGAVPYEESVTNMMVAAAPSYCPQEKMLVLTDGLSVSIKNIRKGTDTLLPRAIVPKMASSNNLEGFPFQFITSVGSIIQASISPSGLFVAAVMEVFTSPGSSAASATPSILSASPKDSNHRASREVFLWFHDVAAYKGTKRGRSRDRDGDGPWVSLGPMGIHQVAVHSTRSTSSRSNGNTGAVSCGQPSSASCGISIDWLHDDTLVLAVSVPVKVPNSDGSKETGKIGTTNRGKPSVSSRATFDIAFTALCVSDLFTGGYCPFISADSSEGVTGSGLQTRGSRPSVSVLRGAVSNLRGMRCLPSSSSVSTVPITAPQGLVHPGAAERGGEEEVAECRRAISVVVWGGSQLLALTFQVNRVNNGTLSYATEVDAIFRDNIGAKGPILSVDMVHYSVFQVADNDSIKLDTSISQINPQSSYTHSTALAVHLNVPITPTEDRSSDYGPAASGPTLFQSHTTLAAVDSLGNVKMGLIPHAALVLRKEGANRVSPSPLLGSYVKIPASNASGTFRTLALSSRAPQDRRDLSSLSFPSPCPSYCLALGSASVIVKVFSVSIVDSSTSSSPSFHLALLYRVNTLFVPDYLFSMPLLTTEVEDGNLLSGNMNSSRNWTPDLLVVGCQGDIGFLPASTYSSTALEPVPFSNTAVCKNGVVLPSIDCLTLRSALSPLGPCPRLLDSPLPGTAPSIVSCPAARLTAVLSKGKLQLLMSDNGVQLPFPNSTGIRSGTALASTSNVLAIGSSCGSVSLYDANTMRLIKVIVATTSADREREREMSKINRGLVELTSPIELNSGNMRGSVATGLNPANGNSPRFCVGGKVDLKLPCPKECSSPVAKMEFICNGKALLVIHDNGLVTVTNTEFIEKSDQTDYSKLTGTRDNSHSREQSRDSGCQADPSSSVYLCSSWTSTVPVNNLLDDQTTGPTLLASCRGSDALDACGFFGLARGSKVHVFKVNLPEHPVSSSPGNDRKP